VGEPVGNRRLYPDANFWQKRSQVAQFFSLQLDRYLVWAHL